MMKYDDLYFASRYNFFTDCVEWYFLPKTEIKVFLKKMDIRGFGWRPSIYIYNEAVSISTIVFSFPRVDDTECTPNPCIQGRCTDLGNGYMCNCTEQDDECDTGNNIIHF